jgi:hypothetical protein
MLCSGLSTSINLLGTLIESFKSLLEIFEHQAHDPSTVLVRGTLPKMNTTLAKPGLSDPVVLLSALFVGALIRELVLLRAKVTIFLLVVAKMALAKRLLLLVQRLAL